MSKSCNEQVLDSQSPDLTKEEPHTRQVRREINSQSVCRFPIMLDLSAGNRDLGLYMRMGICCEEKEHME